MVGGAQDVKIWNQDRPDKSQEAEDEESRPAGEEDGDATKAGGGNLHRGRGATAWGREEGGDDAT